MDKLSNVLSLLIFSLICFCGLILTNTALAAVEGDPVYVSIAAKVSDGRFQKISVLDSNLEDSQALRWFQEDISQELGNHVAMRYVTAPFLNISRDEIPLHLQLRDTLVVGILRNGNLTATAINLTKVSGFGSGQAYAQQPGSGEVGSSGIGFENKVSGNLRETPQWGANQPVRKGEDLTELQ